MSALSPRRQATRAKTTDAICSAALELIAGHGAHGLTMQGLAQSMHRSVGSVYRYFPSKDALLAELQIRTVLEYAEDRDRMLDAAIAAGMGGGAALLMVPAKHFQRWYLDRPGHFGLVTAALAYPQRLLPDDDGRRVMESILPTLDRITQLLKDLANRGELSHHSSPRERTLVFWCTVQGIVQSAKISRFAPELMNNDRLLVAAVLALLIGWGARESDALPDRLAVTENWVIDTWKL